MEARLKTLCLADDIKPVSEFRNKAASFLEQVHTTKRPLIITQNGKSAAVLLDVSVYDAMIERMEILRDIEIANKQFAAGQCIPHAEAHRMLKARLKK